ncbi:MAG: response regulator [Candidatus Saccharimonadales bacterium]
MPKVMLVEDDNNLREIYDARLVAEGYEIVSAHDGEEALALAVKEKPDLIISDVMMPKSVALICSTFCEVLLKPRTLRSL